MDLGAAPNSPFLTKAGVTGRETQAETKDREIRGRAIKAGASSFWVYALEILNMERRI